MINEFECDMCVRTFNGERAEPCLITSGKQKWTFCYKCTWKLIAIVEPLLAVGLDIPLEWDNDGATQATETWGGAGPDCTNKRLAAAAKKVMEHDE